MLQSSYKPLETLNIGQNSLFTNDLLQLMKDTLKGGYYLLQLGLQSTQLSDEGAEVLAEILKENRQLEVS